jgi:hypothetical protein
VNTLLLLFLEKRRGVRVEENRKREEEGGRETDRAKKTDRGRRGKSGGRRERRRESKELFTLSGIEVMKIRAMINSDCFKL